MPVVPTRYWLIGITAAVLAHGALAAAMFWQQPEAGARSAGMGGVEVSLGPSGGAPGTVTAAASETTETVEPAESREVTESQPEPAEARQQAEPSEAAAPQPESVTARVAEAEPAESPEPVDETRPVETQRETETPEEPAEPEPEITASSAEPEEPEVRTQPETNVSARPVPEIESKEPPEPEQEDAQSQEDPSVAGSQGKAGTRDERQAGSGNNASGGGRPGASADYMSTLRAWLEKHKRYPRRARRLRQEGTALLYFVMDRQGRVLEYSIRESSGHDILDEEVAAMIERAQPLPGMPEDMAQNRLELVVPVQFFLM